MVSYKRYKIVYVKKTSKIGKIIVLNNGKVIDVLGSVFYVLEQSVGRKQKVQVYNMHFKKWIFYLKQKVEMSPVVKRIYGELMDKKL